MVNGMSPRQEEASVGLSCPDPWEGYGGIPGTATFIASDPNMAWVIFSRFHELSIRNLLYLQNRVASLQAYQKRLE